MFDLVPAVFRWSHGSDKHGVTERDPTLGTSKPSFATGDCRKDGFVAEYHPQILARGSRVTCLQGAGEAQQVGRVCGETVCLDEAGDR